MAEARETLIGVDEILAAKPFEGITLVRPFPDAPSRFRALVAD